MHRSPGKAMWFGVVIAAIAAHTGAAFAEAVQAGVSTLVKREVAVTSPATGGTDPRPMAVGDRVYMNDVVASGRDARAQLLFLDESSFTIGPDSEVVIDAFVYDPEAGTGSLVATAARGTLRFVSGGIGKLSPKNISIKTPVAEIGVRGTMFVVDIIRDDAGEVQEALVVLTGPGARNNAGRDPGRIVVSAAGVSVPIERTGWGTTIVPGAPPTPAAPVPLQVIARVSGQLTPEAAPTEDAPEDTQAPGAAADAAIDDRNVDSLAGQGSAAAVSSGETAVSDSEALQAVATLSSGGELEDAAVPPGSTVIATSVPGSGIFNNVNLERSTFEQIASVSLGSVSYLQNAVPIVSYSGIPIDGPGGTIFVADTSGATQLGSYDFMFKADFASKTFDIRFVNIDVPSLGVINEFLTAKGTLPASGAAFVFADQSGAGTPGVNAGAGCVNAGCDGRADLLTVGGNPIGAVAHQLFVGNLVGPPDQIGGVGLAK